MRFFFVYGSLLDRDVTAVVIGRRLPPTAWVPARLPGYRRSKAKGATYPIAVRDPRAEIEGAVFGAFSKRDVERLEAYEGPRYHTVPLKVWIGDRLVVVSGFAPKDKAFQPAGGNWSLTEWQRRDKRKFVERIRKDFNAHPAYSRR
jgi:hypothetical protein